MSGPDHITRKNRLLAGNHTHLETEELNYVRKLVEAKYATAVGEDVAHAYPATKIAVDVFLGNMAFSDAIIHILAGHPKLRGKSLSKVEHDKLDSLHSKIINNHSKYYLRNEIEPHSEAD